MLETYCGPESPMSFHVLNAYHGFLTCRRVSLFEPKIYVRNTNLAPANKEEDATKTQSFGPLSAGLRGAFFVLRVQAVILSVKHEKWGQMSSVPRWAEPQRRRAAPRCLQYWDKCVPPHKKDANVWRPYGFGNFLTISDNLMDWVNPPFKQLKWVRTKTIMPT